MSPIVDKGDTLIIPFPGNDFGQKIKIEWSQSSSNKLEDYSALVVKNESKANKEVVLFIQAQWYNETHLSTVAEKVSNGYKIKVDGKFQYGEANANGDGRFAVYHDKERKPYQHRFVKATLASKASNVANSLAKAIGGPAAIAANLAKNISSGTFGDYLKTF